jgi:AraC-like DNA-binding protein
MAPTLRDVRDDKPDAWARTVDRCFFPVQTIPLLTPPFSATLKSWQLGDLSLTLHDCDPVCYRRDGSHIRRDRGDRILVTFPIDTTLHFMQDQTDLFCRPGEFFMEFGFKPYEFVQQTRGQMWSIMLPADGLRNRLRNVDSYAPYTFDARHGAGSLLFDIVRTAPLRLSEADDGAARGVSRVILDLLHLALEANPNVLGSRLGSVQKGHVARIETYIRHNLSDPTLTPESVAAACGISVRYLHGLFRATGNSISRWILEQRLNACHEDLGSGNTRGGIAEVAFRWGFSDHSHFSRHYRRRFGLTPRERRIGGVAADAVLSSAA